jgi:hypothetical protein
VHLASEADLDRQVAVIITDPFLSTQLASQEGVIPALLRIIGTDNVDEYVKFIARL